MNVRQARVLFAQIGAALAIAAFVAGCGDNYRPVVTPNTQRATSYSSSRTAHHLH